MRALPRDRATEELLLNDDVKERTGRLEDHGGCDYDEAVLHREHLAGERPIGATGQSHREGDVGPFRIWRGDGGI